MKFLISEIQYKNLFLEQETPQQKLFQKEVESFAKEIEVLKSQKMGGGKWDSYNKQGVKDCEPCHLTVTGTISGDIQKKSFCINKKLYDGRGWDCPQGFNLYSVLTKEYEISSISKENQSKIFDLVRTQLPTIKYVDPLTTLGTGIAKGVTETAKSVYEYRHGILTTISLLSLFIPVVGPILSLTADLVDAGLYYGEGKKYTAGLTLIFGLIPAAQLAKMGVKKTPSLASKIEKLAELEKTGTLKEGDLGKLFTKEELKSLEKIGENLPEVKLLAQTALSEKMISKVLPGTKLGTLITWFKTYGYKNPIISNIIGQGLMISGVWYSWHKLANMSNITDLEEKFNSENGSQQLAEKIKEKVGLSDEKIQKAFIEQMNKLDELKQKTEKQISKSEKNDTEDWLSDDTEGSFN